MQYQKDTVYHLVGGKSVHFEFHQYQKVFPNIKRENIVVVEDAGHWVHFDKPLETIQHIKTFLDDIDSKS